MADIAPTLGWICIDTSLLAIVEATLDVEYEKTNGYRLGRIGCLNVVVNCLPEQSCAVDAAHMAQIMATSFNGIEAILITGFVDEAPSAGIRLGDVIISQVTSQYEGDPESNSMATSNIMERASHILQQEVGAAGYWLQRNLPLVASNFPDLLRSAQRPSTGLPDYPRLHYRNIGSVNHNIENERLLDQLARLKDIKHFDTGATGLVNPQIPITFILGISNCADSSENDNWKRYAAVNAVSYGMELIQVMTNSLMNSISDLKGTEKTVPPPIDPVLPPFQPHQYPSYGNAVLLVIPTENEFKRRLLQETFRERAPNDVTIHAVTVSVDSGVGEQPYNEAGIIGAHNRISNALLRLDTPEYQEMFKEKGIRTVICASIESYFQTDNIDRPTDYGVVVIHNATTHQTSACTSEGVTAPPAYVNRARRFGFEGDQNRGRVTVGQILAAHVPGLDKANWQEVLANHSRYDLLKDAVRQVSIPW